MQHWDLLATPAPEGTRDPVVLHSDDSARAVLVVLKPGQSLGDHQVKEHAWVTVVDGSVRVSADGQEVELGAGGLVRFEPNERHALTSDGGARVLLLLAPWPGAGHYRGGSGT
ncbi:MAG TPA: cupin domain-containing protein [Gaiellaceae bacterium]|nr:cupin domain-containing protein [Gaiellaceae bacterium]